MPFSAFFIPGVSSAYGGGSVEEKNSTTLTGNLAADLIEARGFMEASFGNISGGFGLSSGSNWGPQTSSKHSLSHLCWNGGDSHHWLVNTWEVEVQKKFKACHYYSPRPLWCWHILDNLLVIDKAWPAENVLKQEILKSTSNRTHWKA